MGYQVGPIEDFALKYPDEAKKLLFPCNFNTYSKNL
jgi:hypothetical protein